MATKRLSEQISTSTCWTSAHVALTVALQNVLVLLATSSKQPMKTVSTSARSSATPFFIIACPAWSETVFCKSNATASLLFSKRSRSCLFWCSTARSVRGPPLSKILDIIFSWLLPLIWLALEKGLRVPSSSIKQYAGLSSRFCSGSAVGRRPEHPWNCGGVVQGCP